MVFCLDRRRCFQACGHLRGQVQAADAGVMALKVFPEPPAQGGGQLPQAAVIQCGLPLPQVVHQQVTDWPAGQVVTVDQLVGRALARGCQLPQRLRCRGIEDPHPVEHPVERPPVRHRLGVRAGLGVQQLQDVANGDLPSRPPLAPMMTAPRCRTCARASGETCGSRSHSSRSRANPSASLAACMPDQVAAAHHRTREPAQPGRTTSAQITVSKAADSRPSRASEYWPRLAQPAAPGHRRQPRPAVSAPLASHRSCQLSPGWSSSQSSSDVSPSARSFCAPALSDTNGAQVSRSSASSRFAVVAGQPAVTGRAREPGTHAREGKRGRGTAAASCSWTRVTTPRSRTGRPAPRAGSQGRSRTRPPGRLPGLLSVVGQHPADHFLLARRQVDLGRRELGMAENELHVGERQGRVLGHPVGSRMTQRMQRRRRAGPVVDPLEHAVHRVIGQRPDRAPQRPPQRLPPAPSGSARPSPPGRAAAIRTRRWRPAAPAAHGCPSGPP